MSPVPITNVLPSTSAEAESHDDVNNISVYIFDTDNYRRRICSLCSQAFTSAALLDQHLYENHADLFLNINLQRGQGLNDNNDNEFINNKVDLRTSIFKKMSEQSEQILRYELIQRRSMTIYFKTSVIFKRRSAIDDVIEHRGPVPMQTFKHGIFNVNMIPTILHKCMNTIETAIEHYEMNGSGWIVDRIFPVEITIGTFSPFKKQNRKERKTAIKK
jgi:hypothetical protein